MSSSRVKQVQLADAIRALLTTDPWELFFGIIEPAYLELTMELCSTFHLQTVMTNYDDPRTVQFCLGGLVRQLGVPEFSTALCLYMVEFKEENDLHALNRHIHHSPSWCWDALVPRSATYDPSCSKATALPPSLRYLHSILSHTLTGRREHRRRRHSRRLLLLVYVARACLQPHLLYHPCHSPPDGVTSEGGYLHWPLCDSTGVTFRAP
ncbi:hypothetical protein PVK06_017555 [Gossypium arboreum]|uniref:Uncharacterized protein n=1 Tax=Gossypium arboreum TaxID=29729 RepID=A0ABR0Q3F1_GOSAR|nr:hypothetical protein PVK06_017555 [Gossypium arboreum]